MAGRVALFTFRGGSPLACRYARGFICQTKQIPNLATSSRRWLTTGAPLSATQILDVKPFGNLVVRTRSVADIDVKPLNPQKFPLQNKAVVTLTDCAVRCEQSGDDVHLLADDGNQPHLSHTQCKVEIPMKFDVDIIVEGACNVSLQSLENYKISIKTDKGKCYLKSIQTGDITVETNGGSVECRSVLQGNGAIHTKGEGIIEGDRVQGLDFQAESEAGSVEFKAIYADVSRFITRRGNVSLKSCHRHSTIEVLEKGDVHIGSFDGNLNAKIHEGSIDVYVANHETIDISTEKGDITVKLPESVNTDVNIDAPNSDIHEDFMFNEGRLQHIESSPVEDDSLLQKINRKMNLSTKNGTVTLKCQDWISSLNLSGKLAEELH